ncbi:hypothetical protein GF358_00555 [Candidatus Woesearchaeota archaeon]|nr:hypothetical protein [Candidatus Woesearchaeota archaeon]
MTNEQVLFEQPKIIKVGKPFYDDSLPDALEKAQKYAGGDGHVMSLPELADARILAGKKDYVWNNWFTLATEEDKGKTKQGNPVYVVAHGKGILTNPDRIRQAYEHKQGLTSGAARLTETEFNNLLKGKLPDKTEIPVFSYVDFIKQTELPLTYAVVLDFGTVKKMQSGVQDVDSLRDNELVIARLGGVERSGQYLDKANEVYGSRLGNWHDCESVDLDICSGRLVFAGDDGDLLGDLNLGNCGRFVGVPIHAEGVALDSTGNEGIVKPKLEQILNLAIDKGFVAERLQEQFKKELHKLYE